MEVGGQRVYFGTSEHMPEVAAGSVTLVVTSPPYWNLKDYGHTGQIGDSSYEHYLERLAHVWDECFSKANDRAVLVVNVNSRRYRKRFYPIAFDLARTMRGWKLWDHLVWYVPNALPQPNHYRERLFDNKYESLLVFIKGDPGDYTFHKPRVPQKYRTADPRPHKKNERGRCIGNVIRTPAYRPPNVKELGYHVAAYPEEIAALMIEAFTDPGDVVLDPFLGSGTTLKVARVMRRSGIGYELNPEYRDLIHTRLEEPWAVPDWRTLDILHSSTMATGSKVPRKVHLLRGTAAAGKKQGNLFSEVSPRAHK
ncbi:MAG TPA: site-specific DNA-methyltransferase [Anaeromyxobacteraceae bacterium]|nr:site-specific DNA-methyltransferase [Anaeromyxobacteraceae bacterium]